MKRSAYLPGAEVWRHPDSEKVFARQNQNRRMLVREKSSTEDILRDRLKDLDAFRHWARRYADRGPA